MKVHALILVLLAPWLSHAEPQYYGSRVESLALRGAESDADLQIVPIHAGDLITIENIRASIQALYNTGHYSQIEVDAATTPAGTTNLTFLVRPVFFFSTFKLEPENLVERSLSGHFRLPFGERFSNSAVDRIVQETAELLKSEGYFEATVSPKLDFNPMTHLVSVTLGAAPGPRAKVVNVMVRGGEETFPKREELLDALGIKAGDTFSASRLEQGLSRIRTKFTDLGFLNTIVTPNRIYKQETHAADLEVAIQPGRLTLVLPREFDISRRKLRELVPIYEEGMVDDDLVEEGRVRIERYMQQEGYFEARVTYETIEVGPELGNAIQINYVIAPGLRHKIESVEFEGNHHFTKEAIQERTRTRKAELVSRGVFSFDILEEDKRAIETMYRNAGFQGTVVRPDWKEVAHAIRVVFHIEEGKQARIEVVRLIGNRTVPEDELRKALGLKEKDTYTPIAVDQARARLTQLYYSQGFSDVRVEPNVELDGTSGGMRMTFQITEGESYRIGEILVGGNTLTQEKIIHRNFSTPDSNLFPNTPYNPEAILEGQRRLYATGLFSRVEIVTLQQNLPGVRNLLIQVEDAQPILVTYGIGYQEFERLRGTIDLSHNNLFGQDRSLSFRLRGSRRERFFQSTYREPKLFNHDLDGFGSFFIEHTERKFFTANRIDFSLQVAKRISPRHSLALTMGYQTVNQSDIRVNLLAEKLPAERGVFQIARVGARFVQDRRDDPINPSSGTFNTTTFQIASRAIGSELNFTSLYNLYNVYTPVPYGVFAASMRLGWNHPFGKTTTLPPTERYFAGGSTTLRGFDLDEARPGGGHVAAIGNFEYRVPLSIVPIRGVGGALFYDTGNVFPTVSDVHLRDFTHTAGFGLRYQTPVGPVRIDWGFNLKPRFINREGLIAPSLSLCRSRSTLDASMSCKREERVQVFFTLGNPF